VLRNLSEGDAGDVPCRALDRAPYRRRHPCGRRPHLARGHLERWSGAVEPAREPQERRIPFAADPIDDGRDPPLERAIRRSVARQHTFHGPRIP
jgi:hypothetical protein